jgi:hypothetical protein
MGLFWNRSGAQVQLATVHRFADPAWADIAARLRNPAGESGAREVAAELTRTGHVVRTSNENEVRQVMVDAWFDAARDRKSIALVTATHAEAQSVSEAIQSRRAAAGAIDTRRGVTGQAGQSIFVGDIVQTRRNDTGAGVQNRQSWVVKRVTADGVALAALSDSSDMREITHAYAASHLHLRYASTVYGVQGETADRSLVGPEVGAAGPYVGMTRGRERNDVVLVAPTEAAARGQLVETMRRHEIEETIQDSRAAARTELDRAARAASGPSVAATSQSGAILTR